MFKKLSQRSKSAWCGLKLTFRWHFRRPAPRHGRSRELIVSLTSYPGRFSTLHLTLKSLMTQSVRPDRVILWLAEADRHVLPTAVEKLQRDGLEIRCCDDLLSFKKIIPTLSCYPNADIVTADDDEYYWPDWLRELITAAERFPGNVVAHRLHKMVFDAQGIRPYREWHKSIEGQTEDPHNIAIGCLGVFYPAGCFHPEVLNRAAFMQLCPTGDDLWLYWMVRSNGRFEIHSGSQHGQVSWHSSQKESLWNQNRNKNDIQINAMIRTYGLP